jgi:hypothetical protein
MMHSCFVRFQGALMFFSWWFNVQISCIPTEFIHFKSSGSFSLLITGEVISATKTAIFCSDYLKQWIQRESSEIMFAIVTWGRWYLYLKIIALRESRGFLWESMSPQAISMFIWYYIFLAKKMLLFHYLVWLTLQDSTRGTKYISTLFWRWSNPVHDMKLNMLTI